MFCTKVQKKTRPNTNYYWNRLPWEDAGKPKWKRIQFILVTILCLIPVVNIVGAVAAIIVFINKLSAPSWNSTNELVYKRLVFQNIVTDWLMEEV